MVGLPDVGCVPVPPCETCGAAACDHLRTIPASLFDSPPRTAIECALGEVATLNAGTPAEAT